MDGEWHPDGTVTNQTEIQFGVSLHLLFVLFFLEHVDNIKNNKKNRGIKAHS